MPKRSSQKANEKFVVVVAVVVVVKA